MPEDKSRVDSLPKVGSQLSDEEIREVRDIANTLYLIKGLYEEMASARDHLDSVVSRIVHAHKQFQGYMEQFHGLLESSPKQAHKYLEKFAAQGEKIPQLIQQTLRTESVNIAKTVAYKTHEGITEQSNKTLWALEDAMKKAGEKFNDYGNKTRLLSKWFLAFFGVAAIVGGLVGGMLVSYYAGVGMDYANASLDQETRTKIAYKEVYGDILAIVLPKLSKAEREKILTPPQY